MKSLSGIGLGLSVVFGCLLLALIAELYYLLWWKKRNIITKTSIDDEENGSIQQIPEERLDFFNIFICCLKKPTSVRSQELCSSATLVHEPQQTSNTNKDSFSWLNKPFGDQERQNSMEIFPRFLFTITEETREDLESEDGNNNNIMRGNFGNLLQILDTPPFLTPTGSPPYFTPPLTPSFSDTDTNIHQDNIFDPFQDSSPSPPPKFKFLRDAEEKLIQRRTKLGEIINENCGLKHEDEENGRFITIFVPKRQEEEEGFCQHHHHNNHGNVFQEKECFSSSSSSQVLPLVSSPPIFKSKLPTNQK